MNKLDKEELETRLRILSQLTTEAIARAKMNETVLVDLKREVYSIKATQPYLIKRIGELSKR